MARTTRRPLKAIARQVKADLPLLDRRRRVQTGIRGATGLSVSVLVHAILLGILALFILPRIAVPESLIVTAVFDSSGNEGNQMIGANEEPVEDAVAIEPPASEPIQDKPAPAEAPPTKPSEQPKESVEEVTTNSTEKSQTAQPATGTSSSEVATVEGAVDRITSDISGLLKKGDLLVVWLFDSSQSLVDDRQRIAKRLEPFFDQVAQGRDQHSLQNAVVAFGKNVRPKVQPTPFGKQIIDAMTSLPVDESGQENVMGAVNFCVSTYRKEWPSKQLMIAIWTDETGDDLDKLEETIATCQAHNVRVSVVGPSSVLGGETALHAYTNPDTGEHYQVPVKRGPDAAMIERIELGYWFMTPPPFQAGMNRQPGMGRRGFGRRLPTWYGGRDLVGMVSGFQPYALTRLVNATKGSYTILDAPEDRGPFRATDMAEYMPTYESQAGYLKDIQSHPLRSAVHEAVKATIGQTLDQPEMMLFVVRDRHNPTMFQRPYYTPSQFQRKLRTSRTVLQRRVARMSRVIEGALAHVSREGEIEQGLVKEYDAEDQKRWKAWYDLTRGRLLATSVRLEEYRLALDELAKPEGLESTTNHVVFFPSITMRSSEKFNARVTEAKRLLERCMSQNQNTPWAYLAQRELLHGPGITIRQLTLTPGPLGSPRQSSAPPKF